MNIQGWFLEEQDTKASLLNLGPPNTDNAGHVWNLTFSGGYVKKIEVDEISFNDLFIPP